MYFSPNMPIIGVIQTWLRWAGHITCIPVITNTKNKYWRNWNKDTASMAYACMVGRYYNGS